MEAAFRNVDRMAMECFGDSFAQRHHAEEGKHFNSRHRFVSAGMQIHYCLNCMSHTISQCNTLNSKKHISHNTPTIILQTTRHTGAVLPTICHRLTAGGCRFAFDIYFDISGKR